MIFWQFVLDEQVSGYISGKTNLRKALLWIDSDLGFLRSAQTELISSLSYLQYKLYLSFRSGHCIGVIIFHIKITIVTKRIAHEMYSEQHIRLIKVFVSISPVRQRN